MAFAAYMGLRRAPSLLHRGLSGARDGHALSIDSGVRRERAPDPGTRPLPWVGECRGRVYCPERPTAERPVGLPI